MDKEEIIKSIKYLEEERKKLWQRITDHDSDIAKKTSDFEKDAKQSSKKTSEYKNRSEEAKLKIDEYHQKSQELKDDIINLHKSTKNLSDKVAFFCSSSNENNKKSEDYLKKIEIELEAFQDNINDLNNLFEDFDELKSKINSLETIQNTAEDFSTKIEALHKNSFARKREIDKLHQDIIGYDEKDEATGEVIHIDGLKDELQETYGEIESNYEELNSLVLESKEKLINDYNTLHKQKEEEFSKTISNWEIKYSSLEKKITDLLPNAVSAGLSYAYHEKKEVEVKASVIYSKKFVNAIIGLVSISLIPFIISVISIYNKENLIDVIYRMPRLVLSILPLYIPILWVAYSFNKKFNLSKRLIEEYTHKEVLSKTFEGLSKHINELEDSEITKNLRNKLLYNILEISSENPGKLISDYNKSDHPLMDALDKSASLSNAVLKLENIPGLSKLATILDRKSKQILKEQADKVNATLGEIVEETIINDIPE